MEGPSYFFDLDSLPMQYIAPGFNCKLIHTGTNTVNVITVTAGSTVELHQHPHLQLSLVLAGSFNMTVGEQTQILHSGQYCLIPGGIYHGGTAITDCKLIDLFSPERKDYKL